MPATVPPPNTFLLTHDASAGRLLGRWLAFVDEAHLRTHYTELLALASAHGNCRFWLLDMRGRNWHTPQFGQWYGSTFAQAVHTSLRQSVFIAYILGPEHKALIDAPAAQAFQCGCAAHGVYPFFFDSEPAAREWLAHQQAHA